MRRGFVSTLKKQVLDLSVFLAVSLVLFLTIDFFMGRWLLSAIRESDSFRIQHPIYHHTLKANYSGQGRWGDWTYKICTNQFGFKDHCNRSPDPSKSFNVAFMGDSFTEGIGLPFEDTFVGMIAERYPTLRIANLGVVSYSPAIYLAKLKELYANGFRFEHVIVFIDIADNYDEANAYDLHLDRIVVDKGESYPLVGLRRLRRLASTYFPLTGTAWANIKDLKLIQPSKSDIIADSMTSTTTAATAELAAESAVSDKAQEYKPSGVDLNQRPEVTTSTTEQSRNASPFLANIYDGIYLRDYPKSEWTYNVRSPHYGPEGVQGNLIKMQREMAELYTLVTKHGATLSIGVYPWPGQLLYDTVDSLHVQIWRDFCRTRCLHFYNTFPRFFKLADGSGPNAVVNKYYFACDAHFNALGNAVIADTIATQGVK